PRLHLSLLDRDLGAGGSEVRFGLGEPVAEGFRIDPCNDLTGLYFAVEVDQHLPQLTGDLRTDRNAAHRIDRARRTDGGHDVAAPDRSRPVARLRSVVATRLPGESCTAHGQRGEQQAHD